MAAEDYPKIIDEKALKEEINPCDDFYQFSCGQWLEKTEIPKDKSKVYRQSTPMLENVDKTLNKILVSYANGQMQIPATYSKKLGDFYKSCLNRNNDTEQGVEWLRKQLREVHYSLGKQNRAQLVAQLQQKGITSFFHIYSDQSLADSTQVILFVDQAGIALQNPAYYLKTDQKSKDTRVQYLKYIQNIFELWGEPTKRATQIAKFILKLETSLAKKSYSLEDQADPSKVNHPMTLTEIKKLAPSWDWENYLNLLKINSPTINVSEPEFIQYADQLFDKLSEEQWETFITWNFLNRYASSLGGKWEKSHFDFWEKYLSGAQIPMENWQHCTQSVEENLGYALAEAYIHLFDGKAIKEKTETMIDQIKEVFLLDIQELIFGENAWMDASTGQKAKDKANLISQKVGAPEKFRNYDSLQISNNKFFLNKTNLSAYEFKRNLSKIGKPVDKSEWEMMPWEVNAYYDPPNNEFDFPFGILQPPSLDLSASDGANFGAFGGGTIGHELTHGFDSSGSQYDPKGNVVNWWTDLTKKKFDEKAQCFSKQASQYTVSQVGLNVNGELTIDENLADQGGVKLGYKALEKILESRPESKPWLNKYSERQQYWIAYAQSWCVKATDASLRRQMTDDYHPPAEFRVNAVMMNRPEFARDFRCAPNSRMSPPNRCSIW